MPSSSANGEATEWGITTESKGHEHRSRPLSALLQLSDSALPAGGFADSGGVEAVVRVDVVDGPQKLEEMVRATYVLSVCRGDMVFARKGHRAVIAGSPDTLREVAEQDLACRMAAGQRDSSVRIGRGLLKIAMALLADSARVEQANLFVAALNGVTPRATVFGALCALFDVDEEAVAEAYGFMAIAGMMNAAVRLAVVTPTEAQAILHRILAEAPDWCSDRWSLFSPLLDVAAMEHEHLDGRLFQA